MINLLNPDDIKQIRAARVNVRLRHYSVATLVVLLIIGGIYLAGFKVASDDYATALQSKSAAEQSLKDFDAVKKEAETYKTNLATAQKILGSEITFSNFMTDVAKVLPEGTILDSLTLSAKPTAVSPQKSGGTELKARATSYNRVLKLKESLEDSTLFSNVRIVSTTTPSSKKNLKGIELTYPFLVTFDLAIDQLGGTKQ